MLISPRGTHFLCSALSELWVQKYCLAAQPCWLPWTCPHALWPQSRGPWSRGSCRRQPHPRGETGLSLWWCDYSHPDHPAQSMESHMPDRQSSFKGMLHFTKINRKMKIITFIRTLQSEQMILKFASKESNDPPCQYLWQPSTTCSLEYPQWGTQCDLSCW